MISPETKKKIQLLLGLVIVVTAARTGYIFYQRHQDYLAAEKQKQAQNAGYSDPDLYVNPKKLYPYDLQSAKQLTLQPVWVREGYHYAYYPFDAATKRVDFKHETGLLGPIEELHVTDVITAMPPGAGQQKQVMAVFDKDGKSYAVPIGVEADGEYKIYSDYIFFVENPRDLYKHWSADVWQSITQHEVKPGMNELQASFALGMGVPDRGGDDEERTVRYPNGGKPLVVVFHNGKAAQVTADTQRSGF
jgi:hypothetical protein